MQLINSEQKHVSTSNPINEQWKQMFALEEAQDEIELLHEQINSLRQYLSEQLQQKQELEEELHYANKELEIMNAEILQLLEAKRLFFEK